MYGTRSGRLFVAIGAIALLLLVGCGKSNPLAAREARLVAEANALCERMPRYFPGGRAEQGPNAAERAVFARAKIVVKDLRHVDGAFPAGRALHEAEAERDALHAKRAYRLGLAPAERLRHVEERVERDERALGLTACFPRGIK